jgi:hypothetical protein
MPKLLHINKSIFEISGDLVNFINGFYKKYKILWIIHLIS